MLSIFAELKTKEHGYAKAVAEVCKYALKFSDLSLENTWEAFLTLKGKRLTGSFWFYVWRKIPENLMICHWTNCPIWKCSTVLFLVKDHITT